MYGNQPSTFSDRDFARIDTKNAIEPPRSEIAREIETQEKVSQMLHEAVETLEQRLSLVLINVPEGRDGANAGMPACGSPIAGAIQQNNQRVLAATARISGLIARLAL